MSETLYHSRLPARQKSGAAYTCPAQRCFSIRPIVRCPHTAGPTPAASRAPSTTGDARLDAVIKRSTAQLARRLLGALEESPASAPRPRPDRGAGLPMFAAPIVRPRVERPWPWGA